MTNFGIDISSWQDPATINYDLLAKEIQFAILRAGYTGHGTGSSYHKDEHFERHYAELTQRGIPVGAYWYSCADTVAEGRAEAEACLNAVAGKVLAYPIYFDTEDEYHQRKVSKKVLTDTTIAFCEAIEVAGYYVGIYSSADWFKNELELDKLEVYDKWIANWEVSKPNFDRPYGLWQFTSSIYLSGYSGKLDGNYAYKDYPAIMKANGLNGYPKPKEKPPEPEKKSTTYTVKKGDTLWGIAETQLGDGRRYREIMELNGLDSDLIFAGQVLKISGSKSIDDLAAGVIRGEWGNGEERKRRLTAAGYDYDEIQRKVNEMVKR